MTRLYPLFLLVATPPLLNKLTNQLINCKPDEGGDRAKIKVLKYSSISYLLAFNGIFPTIITRGLHSYSTYFSFNYSGILMFSQIVEDSLLLWISSSPEKSLRSFCSFSSFFFFFLFRFCFFSKLYSSSNSR